VTTETFVPVVETLRNVASACSLVARDV
jgi:hypothetical protein